MADQTQAVPDAGRPRSFAKELSTAAAKKALAPLAAAAATAGTTYLMQKSSELWEERVLPKLREKGGVQAVAKGVLDKAAQRLGGSEALSGLAERLSDGAASAQKRLVEQLPATPKSSTEPEATREQERKG